MLIAAVFWLSVALVAYVYLGYPLLLGALASLIRRPPRRQPVEPSVSLLVAAFNEEAVIEAKIRNALELDYPAEKLEVVVASDGSTDRTAEIARGLADGERVRLLDFPRNRGKISVLNDAVPRLRGEIVAFSDAASLLAPDALRRLVASFADPAVGAVSGVYRVRKREQSELGVQEDLYWKYETYLKVQEAALGSVLGAHGSLYAIRRELYPFPSPDTINDDYVIPIRILQQGHRVAYEPAAVAYEEAQEMSGFGRRVRIMAGNIQQLREIRGFLRPPRWLELFFFLSHKVGRVLVPVAMVAAAASNLLLLEHPLYFQLALLQLGFYALALVGSVWSIQPKVLRLPFYFCMINAAAFAAIYRVLAPGRQVAWKR